MTSPYRYQESRSVKCASDKCEEIIEFLNCRNVRIIGLDLIGAPEKEACAACLYHAEVVVAVTGGDGILPRA